MSKPIKYGLFLFVLLAIVASLLTFVNSITAPLINERQLEKVKVYLVKLDSESEFKEITKDYELPDGITGIYGGYDGDTLVTVVYNTTTVGYSSGDIKVLTAIDVETNTIINTIVTVADKQTADIGDRILTHDFQTAGKDVADYDIVPAELKSPDFNIISGATISSRGFLSGVQIAANHFVENFGE
jgi:electron transport complex protein RnfG